MRHLPVMRAYTVRRFETLVACRSARVLGQDQQVEGRRGQEPSQDDHAHGRLDPVAWLITGEDEGSGRHGQ